LDAIETAEESRIPGASVLSHLPYLAQDRIRGNLHGSSKPDHLLNREASDPALYLGDAGGVCSESLGELGLGHTLILSEPLKAPADFLLREHDRLGWQGQKIPPGSRMQYRDGPGVGS